MSELKASILSSISQLRDSSVAWDDLWLRSEVTMPTLRAELIAQWVEQFAPAKRFRAITIEYQGQLVAALPLLGKKIGKFIEAGGQPANEWSPCGELLLDPQADSVAVLETLASKIQDLPWPLLWLDSTALDSRRWQDTIQALDKSGMTIDYHERFRVGWIPTSGDWTAYRESWTPKHRNNVARNTRRIEKNGKLQVRRRREFSNQRVEEAFRQGFEIEDSNWKGRQGSSVLRSEGMYPFLLRQAQQLAEWGQLELATLELDEKPIAFIYAWNAKGVFHGFKIGHDERYAKDSPGQLLIHGVLEQMYADPDSRGMDCLGPVSPAVSRWKPDTYGVGRMVIAPRRLLGRMMISAYKNLAPVVRRCRALLSL